MKTFFIEFHKEKLGDFFCQFKIKADTFEDAMKEAKKLQKDLETIFMDLRIVSIKMI